MTKLFRHSSRVWQVFLVLTRCFVLPALPLRRRSLSDGPARFRSAFEQLGGAWIKLGQMLAMRFDLLPPTYCDELFKLFNDVKPFPYTEVIPIIRDELGAVPEVMFRSFATAPFASASIGQVHRAVLHTGELVAVKVQRPGIRQQLQTDIELMYAVATVLDWTHVVGGVRSRDVVDEFGRWTADELDYLVEARQAAQLYAQAQDDPLERIARVYREYTTSRVLTTELMQGIPLIEIVSAVREGNTTYLANLRARGHNLDRIVRHLDWNMLNQVFVFGCFHADLHPANLFVLRGDAIGYVDFGVVGQLPADARQSLTRYGWLLFHSDIEAAVKELMRWLAPTSSTDTASARQQLVRAHQDFLYQIVGGVVSGAPVPGARSPDREPDNPYSKLAVDIMRTIRSQQLSLSPSVVAYLKMLMTLGALRHQLASRYDLSAQVQRFFERMVRQQATELLNPQLAMGRLYDASYRIERTLEFVEFLEEQQPLLQSAIGTVSGVQQSVKKVARRLLRLGLTALVVGGVLYFVLTDPDATRSVLPSGVPYTWVHISLLIILVVLILAVIGHARQLGRDR